MRYHVSMDDAKTQLDARLAHIETVLRGADEPHAALVAAALRDANAGRPISAETREEIRAQSRGHEFVYNALQFVMFEFRAADNEPAEDALMDVLDLLVGWCGPHASLAPVDGTRIGA